MEGFKLVLTVIAGILFLQLSAFASVQKPNHTWLTLDGSPPLVIARGGFSGFYPDSSANAYELATTLSVPDVKLWCDVQLTKDSVGICFPHIKLDDFSDVLNVYQDRTNTYVVNGVEEEGCFTIDFTLEELSSINLAQEINSRSSAFDGMFQIETVEGAFIKTQPATGFWLNVQYDIFYAQHNLSMLNYVLNVLENIQISHISSPELNFLRELALILPSASNKTKLVFRFLDRDSTEPSTNQTYGSLLKNLTMIKTFAAGILVPKTYIWPLDETLYLLPHTSLVADAHKVGLEVFAADFANDVPFGYNHSYDPVAEYLSFIDNGNFSVDGVLSDFPITASEARECFAHLGTNASSEVELWIISHLGASGDFPACTDLAYAKAIEDGADVIDCPAQLSNDGVPFCSNTNNSGVISSSLNWEEIKDAQREISSPFSNDLLYSNPKFKNSGKILSLASFLDLAKNASSITGVLIKIENAKYLAEHQDLNIVDPVLDALDKAGYNSYSAKRVMIESTSSSVLMEMMGRKYELVYDIDEVIRGADNDTIEYIKTFADSVILNTRSVLPYLKDERFLTSMPDVVSKFHSYGLPVYVEFLRNEHLSKAFDVFLDPIVEINTYVMAAKVDGVVTDFPKTAAAYRKNRCLKMNVTYMQPVQPGRVIQIFDVKGTPITATIIGVSDVREDPLIAAKVPSPPTAEGPKTVPIIQLQIFASLLMSFIAMIVA